MNTTRISPIPMTGTWYGRFGAAYEVSGPIEYQRALRVATSWAARGLVDEGVELEVEVTPAGDEWVVDVVAHERDFPFERLGERRARIDARGRLVA